MFNLSRRLRDGNFMSDSAIQTRIICHSKFGIIFVTLPELKG